MEKFSLPFMFQVHGSLNPAGMAGRPLQEPLLVSTRVSDSINVSAASWCRYTTSRGEGAAASVSLVRLENLARTFPALNPLLPSAAVFSNRWKHKLQVSVYRPEVWGSPHQARTLPPSPKSSSSPGTSGAGQQPHSPDVSRQQVVEEGQLVTLSQGTSPSTAPGSGRLRWAGAFSIHGTRRVPC